MSATPRLYLDHAFAPGQALPLGPAQANYLFAVLRLAPGAAVEVFNGRDGEWRASVAEAGKRGGLLRLESPQRPQAAPADLWLVFAPLKKARTEMVVEKAVELGVARLCPVLTDRTQGDRLRPDKVAAHVIEAAEQCGATFVPAVDPAARLSWLLDRWDPARALIWCDEGLAGASGLPGGLAPPGGAAQPGGTAQPGGLALPAAPVAVLIGPEGGFSPSERARLAALPFAHPLRLGPRILRAETAALAALVLWQQAQGDWR